MFIMNMKSRKPLGIKEKPPFPAAFEWWSCGESEKRDNNKTPALAVCGRPGVGYIYWVMRTL